MKKINTKNTLLAASIAVLFNANSFAASDQSKVLEVTFSHPQSIAINDATTTSTASASANTGGSGTQTSWKVTSNNAVKIKFTGASKDTSGGDITTPVLAKQEVDAKNSFITGQYDQLTTEYGVVVSGSSSTEKDTVSWGGGSTPAAANKGTPGNLVSSGGQDGPTETFGAIMPDDNGEFTYTLYTKGTGDSSSTQSGNYKATITTTITAEEKLGS